jgi:DNA processing protein
VHDNAKKQDLLNLLNTPGIGPQRIRNLIDRFKTPSEVYRASVRELIEIDGIDRVLAAAIKNHQGSTFAGEQIKSAGQQGVQILGLWDEGYPPRLAQVFDPPIVLYVKGSIPCLSSEAVAVVGTRSPSEYGKMMATKFTRDLVQHGLQTVSGLARGVDTICHHETIAQGGSTVAVLGSGLDQIYPYENKKLAAQICERGAMVSEYPIGTKPDAPHFPRRNRIIAGLCLATLVIEAGETSGALITADNALEYGREVMAVPGPVHSPKSKGCNHLIQQGAKLVQCVEDVLVEIGAQVRQPMPQQTALPLEELTEPEGALLALLTPDPQHIDLLAEKYGQPTFTTLALLLQLELKNRVVQLAGKKFARL